jgi:hypothetical protein
LVTNQVIGVDADAAGGINRVEFWVEGTVRNVTTRTVLVDTDANGLSRSREGYWITLDAMAFRAISTTGSARIFATAVPNDVSMQSRVIGITSGNAATDNLRGDYAMTVFPRTVENDWIKTIAPTGADYTTIASAIAAARAALAEAPLMTIITSGSYELTNAADNYANGKGYGTLTHGANVVAMIGRAAAFTPNSPASWSWLPGWDGMEFRGSGIVFDQRNWTTMAFTAKPAWFNGCRFTNSIGTRDTFYWNGSIHPGFGPAPQSALFSYWDDVSTEFVSGALQLARYARGNTIRSSVGDQFSGCHYVSRNTVRDWTGGAFQPEVASLRVRYTPPGGQTTATVSKTGSGAGGTFVLKVNGATVQTFNLGTYGGDANLTISDLAASINTYGNGFVATVLSTAYGLMRAAYLGGDGGSSNPTDASCFNTDRDIIAAIGIHSDWWQGYSGSSTRENVMLVDNICRNAFNNNAFINNDDAANGGQSWDHIVKRNVWLGMTGNTAGGGAGPSYFGGKATGANSTSHYVFEANTMEAEVVRRQATPSDTVYSSFKNNIVLKNYVDTTNPWDAVTGLPPWINNFYIVGGAGTMNAGTSTGNVAFTALTFGALFRDYLIGDVRPALAGPLLANLFPRLSAYDQRGGAFAANDVAGAWSKDGGVIGTQTAVWDAVAGAAAGTGSTYSTTLVTNDTVAKAAGASTEIATFPFPQNQSGWWFWQVKVIAVQGESLFGVSAAANSQYIGNFGADAFTLAMRKDGLFRGSSPPTTQIAVNIVNGDVIDVVVNLTTAQIWWSKDGVTWWGAGGSSTNTSAQVINSVGGWDATNDNRVRYPAVSGVPMGTMQLLAGSNTTREPPTFLIRKVA